MKLKEFRTQYKISQRTMAEMLGINRCSLQRYEKGTRTPNPVLKAKIEKIMAEYAKDNIPTDAWIEFHHIEEQDDVSHVLLFIAFILFAAVCYVVLL